MIRAVFTLVILALAFFLVYSFMKSASEERPIDVEPVDESTGGKASDDDVIDVDPIVEE